MKLPSEMGLACKKKKNYALKMKFYFIFLFSFLDTFFF